MRISSSRPVRPVCTGTTRSDGLSSLRGGIRTFSPLLTTGVPDHRVLCAMEALLRILKTCPVGCCDALRGSQ